MTKTITLLALDGNTSEVSLNGTMTPTGICVRQCENGTEAWVRKTGKAIALPKTRYTLSNKAGVQELADDLDEMGLLGKHYYVRGSFQSAEWTEHKSIDLSVYYEDSFDVGDFLSDEAAIEATAVIQSEHDEAACCALKEAGFDDDLGGDAPCYVAHLFREDADEDVQIEQ